MEALENASKILDRMKQDVESATPPVPLGRGWEIPIGILNESEHMRRHISRRGRAPAPQRRKRKKLKHAAKRKKWAENG